MRNIDELLKTASRQEINIPPKIDYRIQNVLKNKSRYKNRGYFMKKALTVFASIIIILISSVSAYSAFGGTISGKPVLEWIGIRFSDNYEEYRQPVRDQEILYNDTKVELTSTVCDEGFTILEFDVKLSKEDKEYLRLGEKVITETDIEEARKNDETQNTTHYSEWFKRFEALENTLSISFGNDLIGDKNEVYGGNNIYNVLIDDEGYYVKEFQTTTKISDYEYKIYQLYFLTEQQLKGKTNYTITLRNNKLENMADIKDIIASDGIALVNTPNNERSINLDGEFNVSVSKAIATSNSKIIENINQECNYKNMTKTIEKVTITPMQTVVKVNTVYNNVSLNSLSSTRNENHFNIKDYKIFNDNGEQLISQFFETKRVIAYENGKTEEWATGDIGTYKNFENATMQLTEYIIIENADTNVLKLVPIIEMFDGNNNYERKSIELEPFNVELR